MTTASDDAVTLNSGPVGCQESADLLYGIEGNGWKKSVSVRGKHESGLSRRT